MCKHNVIVIMRLPVAADLSHTGKKYYHSAAIDKCIADIVDALNKGGLETKASCCGHGKGNGSIVLMDGRELEVLTDG